MGSSQNEIKQFEQKQILVSIAGLFILIALSVIANNLHLQSVANQSTRFISRMIQMEDFREVGHMLHETRLEHFTRIHYNSSRPGQSASLPTLPDDSAWARMSTKQITLPTHNPLASENTDTITFEYNRYGLVPYAVSLWALLVLVSIPQTRAIKRKLIEKFDMDIVVRSDQVKAEIARQVRHNLRTPLAALMRIPSRLPDSVKADRELLASSITQIKAITSALDDHPNKQLSNSTSNDIYSSLIQSVREISIAIPSKITFSYEIDDSLVSARVPHLPHEFRALLGNIVSNAVEAIGSKAGSINVKAQDIGPEIRITIEDNGRGIDPEIIESIFENGFSHGKISGSGIGLYHAKTWITQWGGRIRASSTAGENTIIQISLPIQARASWYLPRLKIGHEETIVVLDDQLTARHLWRLKLHEAKLLEQSYIFESSVELEDMIRNSGFDIYKTHFLFDYDLGTEDDGLDLLHRLPSGTHKYLFTGHFDQLDIQKRCEVEGVFLIPKSELSSFKIVKQSFAANARQRASPCDPH